MIRISILGSTGSIGRQALDVIARYPELFSVESLSAYSDAETLFAQVERFRPRTASLAAKPEAIPARLLFCDWVFGQDALADIATHSAADSLLVAVVGSAGLLATMAGIAAGKRILLANKEALVAGGELVMRSAEARGVQILPVDSEHSAIFQCLQGAQDNAPAKIHLCASGGPFLHADKAAMDKSTRAEALRHPNWAMGAKITTDCATMMNKGLEFIEAHHLFGLPPERIEVLIQPQSVIHSMVEYEDGSVIAQMAAPDMRLPILYALAYPERLDAGIDRLSFPALGKLDFFAPDYEKFRCLALAIEALKAGGAAPAILNAANEIAVEAFLQDRILLGAIPAIVEETLNHIHGSADTIEGILFWDREAREYAAALLPQHEK